MGSERSCQLGQERPKAGEGGQEVGGGRKEKMDWTGIRDPGGRQALSETVSVTRLPCYAPRRRRAAASWVPGKTGKGRSASRTPDLDPDRGPTPDGITRRLGPSWVARPAPAPGPGRGQAPNPLPGSPGVRRAMTQHVGCAEGGANETDGAPAGWGGTMGKYACSVSYPR